MFDKYVTTAIGFILCSCDLERAAKFVTSALRGRGDPLVLKLWNNFVDILTNVFMNKKDNWEFYVGPKLEINLE